MACKNLSQLSRRVEDDSHRLLTQEEKEKLAKDHRPKARARNFKCCAFRLLSTASSLFVGPLGNSELINMGTFWYNLQRGKGGRGWKRGHQKQQGLPPGPDGKGEGALATPHVFQRDTMEEAQHKPWVSCGTFCPHWSNRAEARVDNLTAAVEERRPKIQRW